MSKKIVYRISSHHNISFNHVIDESEIYRDLGYTNEDWDALTEQQREELIYDDDVITGLLWDNVEIHAEVIDE